MLYRYLLHGTRIRFRFRFGKRSGPLPTTKDSTAYAVLCRCFEIGPWPAGLSAGTYKMYTLYSLYTLVHSTPLRGQPHT